MTNKNPNIGKLFIVSTPIGNLGDMTLRAIETLKNVDLIACEDTRHSKILLDKYSISKPMASYYEVKKEKADKKSDYIIREILGGKEIALITDAGTPGISDPGQYLIQKAVAKDIEVVPIPGPSALSAALSVCGFNDRSYFFVPFLPKKKGRQTLLTFLSKLESTIIFYESPQRIGKTLIELASFVGENRPVVICRELTKQFEEIFRGSLNEAIKHFTRNPKGEFVVVLKGYDKKFKI